MRDEKGVLWAAERGFLLGEGNNEKLFLDLAMTSPITLFLILLYDRFSTSFPPPPLPGFPEPSTDFRRLVSFVFG